MKIIYALLAACLFTFSSCHSGSDEPLQPNNEIEPDIPRRDISLSSTEETIFNKTQEFSLNLIKETLQNERVKGKNLFFSPWGVSAALNMLRYGADGNTATEIYSLLSPDGCTTENVNGLIFGLNYQLCCMDNTTTVVMDHSLWVSNTFSVKNSYTDFFKNSVDSEVFVKDFSSSQATQDLCDWCSEKTKGSIKGIGLNLSNSNMIGVSAFYFKGYWNEKFDESETKTNIFYGTTNSSYVKIMHKKKFFKYATCDDFTTVNLPYGNTAYSMQLVLPPKGCDMAQAGKQLAEGLLGDLTTNAKKTKVYIELPRFDMTSELSLKEVLSVLGVKDAFDATNANFSKVSDGPLYLQDLMQEASIHVDENGASIITCKCGDNCPCCDTEDPDLVVSFNRPFFFFIREQSTGAIMFMGKVENL